MGVRRGSDRTVDFGEFSLDGDRLDVQIDFELTDLTEAMFCVGFVDESGSEVGVAASPMLRPGRSSGHVTCSIEPMPLRTGVYFPVVAILSEDGVVRDRWQLDRAVVIDRNGARSSPEGFGAVDIAAGWRTDGSVDGGRNGG